PFNNVARTSIEAMAAVFGGTQSLHTNALDEAIALPTDFSARIARNTQLFLLEETQINRVVDPWGGSHYVEKLTHELIEEAWELIQEIETLGGMTKAIEAGIPKMRIEEFAARRQAKIDSQEEIIVGVNHFLAKEEPAIETLEVDNRNVLEQQSQRLNLIKQQRKEALVKDALESITQAAQARNENKISENLLTLCINAARARTTIGEISTALETAFGRFQPKSHTFTGVYAKAVNNDKDFLTAKSLSDKFAQKNGRRPRIMIAKMGQDGHDRGAKIIATSYADIGFDVDLGPLFQTPEEAAKQAVENDVHILGISSLAAGHTTLVPAVMQALEAHGRQDIKVVVGGVIPQKDYAFLKTQGVVGVYGPGTKTSVAAQELLLDLLDC
ncbi:MAG: methylmalonyl-CoA mutase family protein, partial [Flavobacteriaceae bacterium]